MSPNLRHASWALCALAALWVLPPAAIHAQTLETQLIVDASDGLLDQFDLISACLIASGVADECEFTGWRAHYGELESAVLAAGNATDPALRLQSLQQALHHHVFKGRYGEKATDLRLTLGSGHYNCLSSAVLLYALADAAGIPLEFRLARGHINLARSEAGQPPRVIEASSATASHHPDQATSSRRLTRVQLLGKFYYNRGIELLKDQQFAEGLRLLSLSTRLDPEDADAQSNFVAGINNWAAAQCASGNYTAAAKLIAVGLRLDPNFAPLIVNQQLIRAKLALPGPTPVVRSLPER